MVVRNCAVAIAVTMKIGISAYSGSSPASSPWFNPNPSPTRPAMRARFHTQANGTPNCGQGTRTPHNRGTR